MPGISDFGLRTSDFGFRNLHSAMDHFPSILLSRQKKNGIIPLSHGKDWTCPFHSQVVHFIGLSKIYACIIATWEEKHA